MKCFRDSGNQGGDDSVERAAQFAACLPRRVGGHLSRSDISARGAQCDAGSKREPDSHPRMLSHSLRDIDFARV